MHNALHCRESARVLSDLSRDQLHNQEIFSEFIGNALYCRIAMRAVIHLLLHPPP